MDTTCQQSGQIDATARYYEISTSRRGEHRTPVQRLLDYDVY